MPRRLKKKKHKSNNEYLNKEESSLSSFFIQ